MSPKSGQLQQCGSTYGRGALPRVRFTVESLPDWEVQVAIATDMTAAEVTVRPVVADPWAAFEKQAKTGKEPGDQDRQVPMGGITARLLRQIPIGEITAAAVEEVREHAASHVAAMQVAKNLGWDRAVAGFNETQQWAGVVHAERSGRRGRPDTDYLPLVIAYLDLLREGSTSPLATLAAQWNYSTSTVRNQLHEARRRGLLTSVRGKAGGALTDKARSLLESVERGSQDGSR